MANTVESLLCPAVSTSRPTFSQDIEVHCPLSERYHEIPEVHRTGQGCLFTTLQRK